MPEEKATSAQIAMIFAIARKKGIIGKVALLDWLEFDSNLDIKLDQPDDLPYALVTAVKHRLERLPDSE